ncbi:MAG: adenylate/guanylate cyclase domain-containing protein [Alphaproteobacteria bacterium]|nr:adenylate/guanylate cyclase domain-containing protein [Alphaproteobacteria bacterium]
MTKMRIKLRIGISAMFSAVLIPLTVLLVLFLYLQNARMAREMAAQSMDISGREVAEKIKMMIGGISKSVEIAAAFGRVEGERLRRPDALRPLLTQLETMPEAYSAYFGLHEDGSFYQAVRLPKGIERFGFKKEKPPAAAKWVLRVLDSSSGERRDTYIYLEEWNKAVKIERAAPSYDPRIRPWYQDALPSEKTITTDVYLFSSTGEPGITLSQRVRTDNGALMGVFGADLSISALSEFLTARSVGKSGMTFLLDQKGQLVGFPNAAKVTVQKDGKVSLVMGEDVDDPIVSEAVKRFRAGAGSQFTLESKADGSAWMAKFLPLVEYSGVNWTVGVVVAEEDFVGPVRNASQTTIIIGFVFALLASGCVFLLSRYLVRPIDALIVETDNIRNFELSKPVVISSQILEIDRLIGAVGAMKAGLSSFGSYVPKSLVHNIISSGSGTTIGGVRRPLTVMFTDLQGFTQASESMEPELVLKWLSVYFERMSEIIARHHGTIDKFIGDAIMAFWNAPLDDPNHIENACRAMVECKAALREFAESGGPPLITRMGLHTGQAVVGNVGSSDRMQYTAMGSMVNLASRIEGLNKQLGTTALVTQPVVEAVGENFKLRPFGPVLVSGASISIPVYELLGDGEDEQRRLSAWMEALTAYEKAEWERASQAFERYEALYPDDKATQMYLANAKQFAANGAPADWDGVLKFRRK